MLYFDNISFIEYLLKYNIHIFKYIIITFHMNKIISRINNIFLDILHRVKYS